MNMDPLSRRLQSDFRKVKELVSNSGGSLKLIETTGNPPTSYVMEYHCPSLVKDQFGSLHIEYNHQIQINLGANYPIGKPTAKVLTSIFNPHVFTHNTICLGAVWSVSETLDTLILRIGALLQLDPKVLDPKSPANYEAMNWVQTHKNKLPLGKISFKAKKDTNNKIIWN